MVASVENTIFQYLAGKRILILGFGREGQSSLNFINKYYDFIHPKRITIADRNPIEREDYPIIFGDNYLDAIAQADIVLKSPGISFRDFTIIRDGGRIYLEEFPGVEISSQMDLFLRFVPSHVVGVTGTKGKSTTSTLVYEMFNAYSEKSFLLGNIGVPVLDRWEDYTEDTYLAVEMSSHQLEFVSASPEVAVITNFFPEHLDHYQSYDQYLEAKLNICRYQTADDVLILNCNEEELVERTREVRSYKILVGKKGEKNYTGHQEDYALLDQENFHAFGETRQFPYGHQLLGVHQRMDVLYGVAATDHYNIPVKAQDFAIANFRGIPHRLEKIGTYKGVRFYNDSIATIPEATILALETLEAHWPVHTLIVGGMDRGISYEKLIHFLTEKSQVKQIICLPDTGYSIADKLLDANIVGDVSKVRDMEEAVALAYENTEIGSICLLSPAAASYHKYKNFEHRGEDYRHWVEYYGNQ